MAPPLPALESRRLTRSLAAAQTGTPRLRDSTSP